MKIYFSCLLKRHLIEAEQKQKVELEKLKIEFEQVLSADLNDLKNELKAFKVGEFQFYGLKRVLINAYIFGIRLAKFSFFFVRF